MKDDDLEEKENSIGNKYIICEKIGKGGRSKVFKVKPKGKDEDKYYAAKVYKNLDSEINDYEVEKEILSYLNNKSPYILNLIDNGTDEIKRINRKTSKNNYIILDYMKNGCLFDYIYYPNSGFDEELCKLLFYKIFKAIKQCHDSNICILDIKLDNILLDDNYNPILCDFGFGKKIEDKTKDKITGKIGTEIYMAPEVFSNIKPYDGFQVDIFNLGVALYILITGKANFCVLKNNKTTKLLFQKKYPLFWDTLGDIKNKLSETFRKLFIEMTLYAPSKRININQILENVWFSGLNDEKIKELEEKYKPELDDRREAVINGKKKERENETQKTSSLLDYNRGSDDEECKQYFRRNLDIKIIDKDSIRENYVEIKSKSNKFDPYYFMDKLYCEIEKNNYECEIKEQKNQNSLKFNIILNEKIYINDDEIEEKNEKVEQNDENGDENNVFEKELIVEVKMFKTVNSYLLRFRKKYGVLYDYYENVKEIISIIDEFI